MSSEMRELVNKVEVDVALGKLSAAATFTKMRELLNLAATQGTDGCTETSCERCATAPHARGEMRHAGIGSYPALLARTEAGADGRIDHHKAMQALEDLDDCARMDRGIAATGPYDLLRRYIMQQNRTHPHDASGDAEVRELRRVLNKLADYWIAITRDKDVAHRDRAIIDAYDKGLTKCAAELRAAMQAKEAK